MKGFCVILFICLGFTGCISKANYNELKVQKEKAVSKTEKLESKLKTLQIYQQHLQDSLNNTL